MTPSSPRRIAVIGAGPAGLYAMQSALRISDVGGVDVFEALPAPYGLIRYGVAADHAKTKTVIRVFQNDLASDRVRFFGNTRVGSDVTHDELRRHYDAIIYATGARGDRDLAIPGDDLPGSLGAAEFVSWYSGHPDAPLRETLSHSQVAAVIGAGNVALDVARILAKTADDLSDTDMPDSVLEVLGQSTLTDIHLFARRGPAQAKFTSVELRELGELANADVIVDPTGFDLDAASQQLVDTQRDVATNVRVMREWLEREPEGKPRRLHLHFWTRPVEVLGTDRVAGLRLLTQAPGAEPREWTLDLQVVFRAIGYRAEAIPGLPFDGERFVVPNKDGRVLADDDSPLPGVYVAGWLKRGPSGVIGTNRKCANETVAALAEDLAELPAREVTDPDAIVALLRERQVPFVDWAAWKRLEAYEAALGSARGAPTVKVAELDRMLEVCQVLTATA